jgi:hypothetical protein
MHGCGFNWRSAWACALHCSRGPAWSKGLSLRGPSPPLVTSIGRGAVGRLYHKEHQQDTVWLEEGASAGACWTPGHTMATPIINSSFKATRDNTGTSLGKNKPLKWLLILEQHFQCHANLNQIMQEDRGTAMRTLNSTDWVNTFRWPSTLLMCTFSITGRLKS